jgi:hypothetical protein
LKIMKRLLAGLAALAVVLGLCVLSTGTAFADPGHHGNGNGGITNGTGGTSVRSGNTITCTGTVGTACNTILPNGHTDSCTPTGTVDTCTDTLGGNLGRNVDGLLNGVGHGVGGLLGGRDACPLNNRCGPIPGGPRGGGFGFPIGGYQGLPGLLNGNLLNLSILGLSDGGTIPVCQYQSWNDFQTFGTGRFGGRFGGIRGHFGGNPNAAWEQLRAEAACGAVPVSGAQGLVLVDGQYLNLGGEFGVQDVCSYNTFNDFSSRFGSRFGGRFNSLRGRFGGNPLSEWSQLRRQASCGNTVVVVPSSTTVVQAAPTTVEAAPADPGTTAPAAGDDGASNPQPLASSPTPGPVPSGAVQTGGDSPAFTLLWPWAV